MIRWLVRILTLAAFLGLVGLGVWQVERREWKLALIERVEARLAAAPVPAPAVDTPVDAEDAYTRVTVTGRYRIGHDTRVQAVTDLGAGFWVLTPLDAPQGRVLVNRGFVPTSLGQVPAPPSGAVSVSGLLRLSEPGGGFLRSNNPAADRWYSRDVAAIAQARRLGPVALYFIDADANGAGWPRGGLTVVRFRNSHLVYALTWFAMAALLAFLSWRALRQGTAR